MTQDDLATDDVMILDTWEQVNNPELINSVQCDWSQRNTYPWSIYIFRCLSGLETTPRRKRRLKPWLPVRTSGKNINVRLTIWCQTWPSVKQPFFPQRSVTSRQIRPTETPGHPLWRSSRALSRQPSLAGSSAGTTTTGPVIPWSALWLNCHCELPAESPFLSSSPLCSRHRYFFSWWLVFFFTFGLWTDAGQLK